jgi:hypothetical protein
MKNSKDAIAKGSFRQVSNNASSRVEQLQHMELKLELPMEAQVDPYLNH